MAKHKGIIMLVYSSNYKLFQKIPKTKHRNNKKNPIAIIYRFGARIGDLMMQSL
jgi:hypothetical protein